MSFDESNTVEQMILDAVENLGRTIALEPMHDKPPGASLGGRPGMSAHSSIPKGLRLEAQGCEERATLGEAPKHFSQPQRQRGCGMVWCGDGRNPVGVEKCSQRFPKVARSSQPWAGGHSPVGANSAEHLFGGIAT
jgi:hypothetical protein